MREYQDATTNLVRSTFYLDIAPPGDDFNRGMVEIDLNPKRVLRAFEGKGVEFDTAHSDCKVTYDDGKTAVLPIGTAIPSDRGSYRGMVLRSLRIRNGREITETLEVELDGVGFTEEGNESFGLGVNCRVEMRWERPPDFSKGVHEKITRIEGILRDLYK